MPPRVALVLCLLFIAWLLFRDFKSRTSVSKAMLLPTLMLLILGSRPVSMWFSSGVIINNPGDYLEGSPLDRAFYILLIVTALFVVVSRGVKWSAVINANIPVVLFYCYFGISVLWSDYPFTSFKRWFKDLGAVFVILVILSEKDPPAAIRALYARCAYVLVPLSVVFIKYYPELGRAYTHGGDVMYTGVTPQKNSLGEIVMVFSLFLTWDYLESARPRVKRLWSRVPWDRVILALMGIWLINVSQSKTALVCALLGLALILRGKRFTGTAINRGIFITSISMPVLVLAAQQFSSLLAPFVSLLGRDLTFTGRTDIWQAVLKQKTNPILGTGFYSFYLTYSPEVSAELGVQGLMNTAHNGYLDIYLDGGLLGLGALLVVLVAAARKLSTETRLDNYERLRFAFLIVCILYNLSESMFGRLSPIWLTTLLVVINSPRPKERPLSQGLRR